MKVVKKFVEHILYSWHILKFGWEMAQKLSQI